jgi:hypothetical protein
MQGDRTYGEQAARWRARMGAGEGSLRAGVPAPDFELPAANRDRSYRLSNFAGIRPVALIFGSST